MSRCYLREAGTAANDVVPARKTCVLSVLPGEGAAVPTRKVKNLVRNHTEVDTSAAYSFCRPTDWHVVYFSLAAI